MPDLDEENLPLEHGEYQGIDKGRGSKGNKKTLPKNLGEAILAAWAEKTRDLVAVVVDFLVLLRFMIADDIDVMYKR